MEYFNDHNCFGFERTQKPGSASCCWLEIGAAQKSYLPLSSVDWDRTFVGSACLQASLHFATAMLAVAASSYAGFASHYCFAA